ncbi:hypothetical protein [Spirochaeta isovalerica]|uniref:Lipoprotein n=1 Tax=Spirochaeta isovalerica TaxID=150 RepID=A0A841R7B5_9SPIO|nr:hypothetical protein [Spirochaeta isovalerica]MBB6478392.1 hypothetical protein [Spirochaeta isovalerica]
MFLKPNRAIFFLLPFFIFSCSGKAPEVSQIWWQLNIEEDHGKGEMTESLSLFVHGEDEDGEEDLESLYLINDEHQLFWEIRSDEWNEYSEQSIKWIGSNGILAPGEGHFPDGEYRVLLIDRAGERDEKEFFLKNRIPDLQEIQSPEVSYDLSGITVRTENPLFQIWFYNDQNELVEKSRSYSPGQYDWNQLSRNIVRRSVSFVLYTEPESGSWGWISRSYSFSE